MVKVHSYTLAWSEDGCMVDILPPWTMKRAVKLIICSCCVTYPYPYHWLKAYKWQNYLDQGPSDRLLGFPYYPVTQIVAFGHFLKERESVNNLVQAMWPMNLQWAGVHNHWSEVYKMDRSTNCKILTEGRYSNSRWADQEQKRPVRNGTIITFSIIACMQWLSHCKC